MNTSSMHYDGIASLSINHQNSTESTDF
jgi:hypothetical protein